VRIRTNQIGYFLLMWIKVNPPDCATEDSLPSKTL
jgi:hypothetical protein